MLTKQTFKIKDYEVELKRYENTGTITITEHSEKAVIEADVSTLRRIVKCITDSPYIFSDNNK